MWISVDALRADRLEPYAPELQTSPSLTRLAADGIVFERAYAASSWTKPAMASVFTSTMPDVHGVQQWEHTLDKEQPTVALELRARGWHTAAYVAHRAFHPSSNDFHHGFDTFDSSFVGQKDPRPLETAVELTDAAVWHLEGAEGPFFLWLHYFSPHADYLPHEGFDFGPGDLGLYDGEIAWMDDQLQRVFDAMAPHDPVVVFHADHGEEFGDHGGEHHGHTLFDELVRVPLIISAPGLGTGRVAETVSMIDLAPTVHSLLDVRMPSTYDGAAVPHGSDGFAVEADRVVFSETLRKHDLRMVFDGRYKLVYRLRTGVFALYDVQTDPGEQDDVFDAVPAEVRDRMLELFDGRYPR